MNWFKKIIIAGLPVYTLKEFIKKLKEEFGVKFIRNAKGDDQLWGIPGTTRKTIIPFGPGSRIINPFTMTKMLKNLNIPLSQFKKQDLKKQPQVQKEPFQQDLSEVQDWQKQPRYIEQQRLLRQQSASFKSNWYKTAKWRNTIPEGSADGKTPLDYEKSQVEKGKEMELEHTNNPDTAREIAMDHLEEHKDYYHDNKGLPAMEKKLEDTKDAGKGLYKQRQGDGYNQFVGEEIIQDWQIANREELNKMRTLAKQHRFDDMKTYGEQLVQKGFNRLLVEKIMTAAMYGVKLQ